MSPELELEPTTPLRKPVSQPNVVRVVSSEAHGLTDQVTVHDGAVSVEPSIQGVSTGRSQGRGIGDLDILISAVEIEGFGRSLPGRTEGLPRSPECRCFRRRRRWHFPSRRPPTDQPARGARHTSRRRRIDRKHGIGTGGRTRCIRNDYRIRSRFAGLDRGQSKSGASGTGYVGAVESPLIGEWCCAVCRH